MGTFPPISSSTMMEESGILEMWPPTRYERDWRKTTSPRKTKKKPKQHGTKSWESTKLYGERGVRAKTPLVEMFFLLGSFLVLHWCVRNPTGNTFLSKKYRKVERKESQASADALASFKVNEILLLLPKSMRLLV